MFINIKGQSKGKDVFSVRRYPNGVYYVINDNVVTFDRNPVWKSGYTEELANKEVESLNSKRGPSYGFDFKG